MANTRYRNMCDAYCRRRRWRNQPISHHGFAVELRESCLHKPPWQWCLDLSAELVADWFRQEDALLREGTIIRFTWKEY